MKKLFVLFSAAIILGSAISASAASYGSADIILDGDDYSNISAFNGSEPNTWFGNPSGNDDVDSVAYENAIRTKWQGEWVEYTTELTAGNWNIGANVINNGDISIGWYTQFEILSKLGGVEQTFAIDASDSEINNGFINFDVSSNNIYTIRYTWLNDGFDPKPSSYLDANIQINTVFFDNTATNPVPEPSTMFLLGSGLLGMGVLKRRNKEEV